MKKVITLSIALIGALALLSGCDKKDHEEKKEEQTQTVGSEKKSKEIIEDSIV
jgi:protein involved in sex pheromone biosynthesis